MQTFKRGEMVVEKNSTVLVQGSHCAHLYTVLDGWGFRFKSLNDGRRQILNYILPGDFIGLQSTLMAEMQHSVEALSSMTLCVFERERVDDLFRNYPGLAFDITWLAAREEQVLDENLLALGRRNALERTAYLIGFLYQRAKRLKLNRGKRLAIPITQLHVADTLGLSTVHTNKTLKRLSMMGLTRWRDRGCEVLDEAGLMKIARWEGLDISKRPFI